MGVDLENIEVLSLVALLNAIAGSLFWTVFNLYLWDIGLSLLDIMILNSIPVAISISTSRFFGILADSRGRKYFIIVDLVIVGSSFLALSFLIVRGLITFTILLVLFVMLGIGASVGGGALVAAVTTSLKRERSGEATGVYLSFGALGWMIGSFVSGFVADRLGMYVVSFISGILTMSSVAVVAFTYREVVYHKRRVGVLEALKASWSMGIHSRGRNFILLLIVVALYSFGGSIYMCAFTIKMYLILGSMTMYGVVSGFSGLTNMFMPYIVGRIGDRYSKETLLLCGMVVRNTFVLYLAFTWDVLPIIIFMVAPMWVFIHVPITSLTTDYSEEGYESEAQSLRGIIHGVFNMTGGLAGGLIAEMLNVRANIHALDIVLIIGSTFLFIATLPAYLLRRNRGQEILKLKF